jgi:hypothetical protein
MARTLAEKRADGLKANAMKIALFGPDEPNRAWREAHWTMDNGKDKKRNPFTRDKIYSKEVLDNVKNARDWYKKNPNADLDENPYSWYQNQPKL